MTLNQREWAIARDRLAASVSFLGYPEEFADRLARQLGSPKAIHRMASYIDQAHPGSVEMIVDEMLAICAEIDAWREKKRKQGCSGRIYHVAQQQSPAAKRVAAGLFTTSWHLHPPRIYFPPKAS